jgi:GTP-binding protein EngB required for normal cell division
MAEYQISRKTEPPIIVNRHCNPDQEINILLLGQTGVGKSTFINAFANYVVNDTLEQAVNDEMQVVISSSFSHTVHENFEQKNIIIGKEDKYEQNKTVGESSTLQCRSFVFPIGNRNLRFIDTPGIGDTKGINQDEKNFQEILDYIAQFEHLNAVFVMFKPNEERLTPLFKYSVYELLRHLNIHVKDNIIFIFTNVRSTFFMPGSTSSLLRTLLDRHYQKYQIEVPFSKENTFLFDNEAFRYLALRKNDVKLDDEQTLGYTKSWDHSVNEYRRLMEHIIKLPLHAISHVLSLNEAEQLVRKLPRPIAETARLIEVNIQLAKDHKQKVNKNPQIASQGIPQQAVEIETNLFRTVCISDKCRRVTGAGIDRRVEYSSICHDTCFLTGLEQETLSDCPKIRDCEVMNPRTGICGECRCPWDQHKHITYEVNIHQTHARSNGTTKESSLIDINKLISDLKEEQRQIQDIYKKLAQFLYANSLLPINDGYI